MFSFWFWKNIMSKMNYIPCPKKRIKRVFRQTQLLKSQVRKHQNNLFWSLRPETVQRKNISLEYLFSTQHKALCDLSCEYDFILVQLMLQLYKLLSYKKPLTKNALSRLWDLAHDVFCLKHFPFSFFKTQSKCLLTEDFSLSPKSMYSSFVPLLFSVSIFTVTINTMCISSWKLKTMFLTTSLTLSSAWPT